MDRFRQQIHAISVLADFCGLGQAYTFLADASRFADVFGLNVMQTGFITDFLVLIFSPILKIGT
ncbi:hypothetical protein LJX77_23375 [Vibrio coralliilyticus]|nr:hypothetical protein [Vibrio coralliilyticus]MCC2525069.1 hypothetical protein [Vibrio coralliilyticus]